MFLFEEIAGRVEPWLGGIRNPDADGGPREPSGGATADDTDDGNRAVIHSDDAADDIGIGRETAPPCGLAQDGDRSLAWSSAIVLNKETAEFRPVNAFNCEEVAAHGKGGSACFFIAELEREFRVGCNLAERTSGGPEESVFGIRGLTRKVGGGGRGSDLYETARIFCDVGAEEITVNHGKDAGINANGGSKSSDDYERDDGVAPYETEAVAEIVEKARKEVPSMDGFGNFAGDGWWDERA